MAILIESLGSATRWLDVSNIVYLAGAIFTALTAGWVVYETRAVAAGRHVKHFLLSEVLACISAGICVVGSFGAIYYGSLVGRLKDDSLKAYEMSAKVEIARANQEAARAQQEAGLAKSNAALANATAQRAALDKARIMRGNLALQEQLEQEKSARLQIEARLAPRTLAHQQQLDLAGKLRKIPPQTIEFVVYQGNPESDLLAGEIAWAVQQAKFKTYWVGPVGGSLHGIRLEYAGGEDGVPHEVAMVFYKLFRQADFYFSGPFADMLPLNKEFGNFLLAAPGSAPDPHATLRVVVGTK
ncbi:MAG TPA: hypothetical protein VHU89_18575 [Acidobacteriaceae bacterium]|jgi:hypothetical protein|nr:hypothetical protein [Acidobacteriaceae bacterium]